MNVTELTQVISTVGFPIAACCVMFYQNSKMQETLHEVTLTMQSLVDKIESIESKVDRKENDNGNN